MASYVLITVQMRGSAAYPDTDRTDTVEFSETHQDLGYAMDRAEQAFATGDAVTVSIYHLSPDPALVWSRERTPADDVAAVEAEIAELEAQAESKEHAADELISDAALCREDAQALRARLAQLVTPTEEN